MTNRPRLFTLWLLLAALLGSPTPCLANSAVTLKPEVAIKSQTVRLSDLFAGVPKEIDRDIAQAPPACKPAVYDKNVLNKLADTYRLDWQVLGNADHAVVSSSCARISNDMISDAVIAKLKQDTLNRDRNFDLTFDVHGLELDLPSDRAPDYTLDNFSYDRDGYRFRAELTAKTERGPYTLAVSGHVSVRRSVPVLAHRLEAGTTIAESDLDFQQMPEERVTADVITEPAQLIGRELRRDTGDGSVIHAHDVVPPRLVTRGSLVTMKIETPFITITTQGKAQQDGAQGDVVRVLNTASNRVIEGTVSDAGTVTIHTAQKLASAE